MLDDAFERGRIAHRTADRRPPIRVHQRPARTAVGENERKLARMQLRIDRHRDEPRPPAGEQRFDVFRHVARDDRDAVALGKSRGGERAGDAGGAARASRNRTRRSRRAQAPAIAASVDRRAQAARQRCRTVEFRPWVARYNERPLDMNETPMSLPTMMRHIVAREPGPPDVLTLTDGPVPKPKAGEVLIEVAAAGVNRPDCLQRAGAYPPPADASPIIGLEVAGKIVACGESVAVGRIGR